MLAIATILLFGCTTQSAVLWQVDETMPTAVHLEWGSASEGRASIRYGPEDGRWVRESILEASPGRSHAITVTGLTAGETHELTTLLTTASGDVLVGETILVNVPPAPVGPVQVVSTAPLDGHILTHTLSIGAQKDTVLIMDRDGGVVWYSQPSEADRRVLTASLDDRDGSVWYAAHHAAIGGGDHDTMGHVHHVALDGSFDEITYVDRLHSGVVPLPEGGLGYIKKLDEPWEDGTLLWDEIWELDSDGVDRQIFSPLDWFEPQLLCEHQGLNETTYDWTHANSLILSEDERSWYLMVRHFDAILKIDRHSGELEWVLGGPYGEFTFERDSDRFDHAHMSQQTVDGFVVFDNRNHSQPRASRVMRYAVDEDRRLVHATWDYASPEGIYNSMLGDAKHLPSGHYLISWTERGLLEEVTGDGEVVWSARTSMGLATGRSTWSNELFPPASPDGAR